MLVVGTLLLLDTLPAVVVDLVREAVGAPVTARAAAAAASMGVELEAAG